MSADLPHYLLLRPVLLELKREWPKPARDSMCGRYRLWRKMRFFDTYEAPHRAFIMKGTS